MKYNSLIFQGAETAKLETSQKKEMVVGCYDHRMHMKLYYVGCFRKFCITKQVCNSMSPDRRISYNDNKTNRPDHAN